MRDIEQRRFERQVAESLKHLFGTAVGYDPSIIVFNHEQALHYGVFPLKLSIDEIESYKEETQHSIYTYLTQDTLKRIENEDEDVWYNQSTYLVTTVCSPHESIEICEKKMYGIDTEPCVFNKIIFYDDYEYDTFSCQIFIPVPPDPTDYEMKFYATDAHLLRCTFTTEQYDILKIRN